MNVLDFAVMSMEGLRDRKFRFVLNLVGILIGCAAVTGLISMSQGMKTSIVDDISIFGATTIQVYPTLGGDEAFTSLDWRDLNRLRSIPGVEAAAPVQAGRYGRYDYKGETYYIEIVGVDENYFTVHGGENEVEDGRLLTHSDGAAALLGYNVWNPDDEAMYGVGDRLRIRSTVDGEEIEFTIRVVGTLKKTSGITGSGVDNYVILHLGYFEQVFDTQGKYLAVDLKAETIDDVEGIKQAIEEDFDNLGYYSMDMIMEEVNMITGTVNAVLGGIAGISLLVAGVTIANTMTVSVMERTKEIGTLKAIGAKSGDILGLFMTEALITGVVGGVIGALFGFTLSYVISRFTAIPSASSPSLGVLIVGFAMVTCVVSGLHPAWRASKLNPVEALRHE